MKKEYDFSGGERGRFYRPGVELKMPIGRREAQAGRNVVARGPRFVKYFWPLIEALKKLGGSARPPEVREQIAATLGISDVAQSEILPSGFPRFDNQVHWARFYLAKAGIIDSSSRGVWTLTDKGRALSRLSHEEALAVFREVHAQFQADRGQEGAGGVEEPETPPPQGAISAISTNYRQQLSEILRGQHHQDSSAFASACSENLDSRR